jgi:tetratricopeptide (TPR) repeat protein
MADTDSVEQKCALGEKALDYAKQGGRADPKNAMAQLALAVCYGRMAPLLDNKTKIAYSRLVKEHADKALALDPNNDLTYNVLGSWNYELAGLNPFLRALAGVIYGQLPDASYEEAVKDFEKAVQLNPNRLANHIGLGRAYAAIGNTGGGQEGIERGLSMPNQERTILL